MFFNSFEEVKKSDKYKSLRKMGYSEEEACVFTLIDFNRSSKMSAIVNLFKKSKETSFIKFAFENYFKVEECYEDDMPQPKGMFGGIFKKTSRNVSYSMAPMGMATMDSLRMVSEEAEMPGFVEKIRTDSYERIEESRPRDVVYSPTATFRPTYNTASTGILLSNIRNGSSTRTSMVRTEELLNYLEYDLDNPTDKMFEITKELKTIGNKTYLFLGVQGKKTLPARQNICLLLDVSGSMNSKADSALLSIMAVLSNMRDGDILSLVTYSTEDSVIINGIKLNKEQDIDKIAYMLASEVRIYGCTNGSAGLNKAYDIIEENKINDGVNRVIIITDGDLNFGIHDKDGITGLIKNRKKSGAYFSAIGTGIYNLQDDKLEALAKNGNGNYFVVNCSDDVEKSIFNKYESLVYPIAKNVKAQMEFNPGLVKDWKLIGYENRMLNHEDFRNDEVIAEPFGSGSYFVALFELTLEGTKKIQSDLKYQNVKLNKSDEIGTLTLRFEDVDDSNIKELEFTVEKDLNSSENIEKAIKCAEIAQKLRGNNPDFLVKQEFLKLFH